ncbi:MAG: leucine-rich repeat protein [Prevotella sp.]|nr:leucine-rich repeat protein [Prevotella sp.]
MSKYLKLFETTSEYETYINSSDKVLPNVSFCEDERGMHYKPYVPHDYSQDYFTMVVTSGGNVTWAGSSSNALSYSTDNGATWSTASSSITLPVNEGDEVLWKGTTTPIQDMGIGKFSGGTDVRYSVEGNAMSLLFGDNFKGQTSLEGKNYAFNDLFYSNKSITSAENLSLPATTLAQNCCFNMFCGCTSLTTAPELPATTLAQYCYYQMFKGCTSLTTAPELPATTLAQSCYQGMFQGCTNLTTTPELPATTLAYQCYGEMFYGCTSLTTAPELPATELAQYCYGNMFRNCSSLTTAPELPATTLPQSCYRWMFNGCTSLNSIKCLATNISAKYCTSSWVDGVAASGTFTKAASMTSWTTGTSGIPSNWTVVDA